MTYTYTVQCNIKGRVITTFVEIDRRVRGKDQQDVLATAAITSKYGPSATFLQNLGRTADLEPRWL